MQPHLHPRSTWRPLLAIIVVGIGLRIALTPLYAHLPNGTLDEGFWKHWMQRIHEHGVLNIFRTSDTDYVGYHWVLWLLAALYDWIGGPYTQTTPALHVLVKVPSIVFDIALIAVVYQVTMFVVGSVENGGIGSGDAARCCALGAAAVCAVHPAMLYDSAVWAQTDSAISAVMLGSLVLAYRGLPRWSGVTFGLGFALKPHPIILVPLLAVILWREGSLKAVVGWLAAAGLTFALILAPWLLHGEGRRIGGVYGTLFTKERERLSELAWNIWWIPDQLGDPRPRSPAFGLVDVLTYERLALLLSAVATLLVVSYALRHKDLVSVLIAAAYQAFAFYELPTGSHERYLYPLFVLLLPAVFVRPRWLLVYAPLSATFFLNLVVVAPPMKRYMDQYVYSDFGVYVAGLQALIFAVYTVLLIAGLGTRTDVLKTSSGARVPAHRLRTAEPRMPAILADQRAAEDRENEQTGEEVDDKGDERGWLKHAAMITH